MSDKDFNQLCWADQELRRMFSLGMWQGTVLKIELMYGFELFNTRPYHNHETWSDGYKITTHKDLGDITIMAEDLDTAIKMLKKKIVELKEGKEECQE